MTSTAWTILEQMARINSYCAAMRTHSHQMALITSEMCACQVRDPLGMVAGMYDTKIGSFAVG